MKNVVDKLLLLFILGLNFSVFAQNCPHQAIIGVGYGPNMDRPRYTCTVRGGSHKLNTCSTEVKTESGRIYIEVNYDFIPHEINKTYQVILEGRNRLGWVVDEWTVTSTSTVLDHENANGHITSSTSLYANRSISLNIGFLASGSNSVVETFLNPCNVNLRIGSFDYSADGEEDSFEVLNIVDVFESNSSKLVAYPNPSSRGIVSFNKIITNLEIYNELGQKVISGTDVASFSTESLCKGMYILIGDGESIKFVVQ